MVEKHCPRISLAGKEPRWCAGRRAGRSAPAGDRGPRLVRQRGQRQRPGASSRGGARIIAEVARRPAECPLDSVSQVGVAAIENFAEQVRQQIHGLRRFAQLSQRPSRLCSYPFVRSLA